ncbi:MAG TPA: hypothetical protein VFV75_00660 [Candidatus Polarisedimenticolaceae bacterium]|nr:hypothetical protein [Candidatus Polarisedimenticolaceae bacterium]
MRRTGAIAAVSLSTLLAGASAASTWIVDDDGPADFRSVQAAVYAAYVLSGDTLLVRPGTYRETVYLSAKNLVIRSEKGPAVTILDAEQGGSVVTLENRSAATRLEGFTLRNGSDQTGGGIFVVGGAPVITRNVIEGNEATGGAYGYGYGGGIEIYGAAPLITHNVIRGNRAADGGGGIDVYYSGSSTPGTCCPVLAQNTIVDNVVTGPGGKGGGILVFASEPRIASSILAGNSASLGGGLFVERVTGNGDVPSATTNLLHANLPDPSDSNAAWHLPPSNREADPRLGGGERFAFWPRSDSPAIDAAEAGLPAGADLAGTATAKDGDVNGTTAGDIGALESLGEATGLSITYDRVAGRATLQWDGSINPAARFNVYGSTGSPFPTDGGTCLATLLVSPAYAEVSSLPPGGIRYYLVTEEDAVEGSRGMRSDGTPRPSAPSCAR